jgi:hypothetical protein
MGLTLEKFLKVRDIIKAEINAPLKLKPTVLPAELYDEAAAQGINLTDYVRQGPITNDIALGTPTFSFGTAADPDKYTKRRGW